MEYDLTLIEKEILIAVVYKNNFSPHARSSKTNIFKSFGNNYNSPKARKKLEKGFNRLITIGLIIKHPSGEMTYNINKDAIDLVKKLIKED